MHIKLSDKNIGKTEKEEIEKLLAREDKGVSSDLEQMWHLIDLVWDDYGCDNEKLNWDNISQFYSHPVWLLNGLFAEQDEESMGHRHAISDWVIQKKLKKVVDYGGGFGTLARLVAEKNKNVLIDIYEPHPSDFGLKRIEPYENIKMVNQLNANYECLLSTDVLEHVADPLTDFSNMINSMEVGGYLIIANCFYPVIKCHLPHNFHFRYTFNIFAKMMGLNVVGQLEGSHATIFQKKINKKLNWRGLRIMESMSKVIYLFINIPVSILRKLKRLINK